ncbi:hypothetical protein [Xanthomonas citri]|nr:hypothetical protein [Xanthomonas citri]QTK40189.1 hypothetical protein XcgCFBP7119R_05740 [Xanthomonas citri pv. glycines]
MTREIEQLLEQAALESELYGAAFASTEARLIEAGYLPEETETYDPEESE